MDVGKKRPIQDTIEPKENGNGIPFKKRKMEEGHRSSFEEEAAELEAEIEELLFDSHRKSRGRILDDRTVCHDKVDQEFLCPLCNGILRKTVAFGDCMHRFCRECISKYMRLGKRECPCCGELVPSMRRLLKDNPAFDNIIKCLYPDLDLDEPRPFDARLWASQIKDKQNGSDRRTPKIKPPSMQMEPPKVEASPNILEAASNQTELTPEPINNFTSNPKTKNDSQPKKILLQVMSMLHLKNQNVADLEKTDQLWTIHHQPHPVNIKRKKPLPFPKIFKAKYDMMANITAKAIKNKNYRIWLLD